MFIPTILLLLTGVAFSSASIANELATSSKAITKATVFDLKGNSLGYTDRFALNTHEVHKIIEALNNLNFLKGKLNLEGRPFTFQRRDGYSLVATKSLSTILIEKTKKLVLVSMCQTNYPDSCMQATKMFANKLRAKGQ